MKPTPTHWLTLDSSEWSTMQFFLENECEQWWNPEEGEFAVVNPTSEFIAQCRLYSLNLYE